MIDTKTKLLGLRAIEIPVQVLGENNVNEADVLSILFKPISPKRHQEMKESYQALEAAAVAERDAILEVGDDATQEQRAAALARAAQVKSPIDQTTHLLNETVVSLCFKSGGAPMTPGSDFEFDELDDRFRVDIWNGITDYTYPKSAT